MIRRGSSQTLTGKGTIRQHPGTGELRPPSPSPSDGESSDEDVGKAEQDAKKKEEEQDALTQRLKELERVITNDRLGLVHKPRVSSRSASMSSERHSVGSAPSSLAQEGPPESLSASPQGSIPSIPSPTSGSQVASQTSKQQPKSIPSPTRSPLASPLPIRGQMPFRHFVGRTRTSEKGSSTQASTASSFSDISGGYLI